MKKYFFILLFLILVAIGCGKVYIVSVTPRNAIVSQDFSMHLEAFLRPEGFVHWSESPDEASREFSKRQIGSDKTLKDLWSGPGSTKRGSNESIVLFVLENREEGSIKLRFVYQRVGDEFAAQKRAGILATKLKDYLDSNLPDSRINVTVERVFDLR